MGSPGKSLTVPGLAAVIVPAVSRRSPPRVRSFIALAFLQFNVMAIVFGAPVNAESKGTVVNISAEEQNARIQEEHIDCLKHVIQKPHPVGNETYCPRTWDDLLCWPDTPPGTIAVQSCPDYVHGFKPWRNASRICMDNGSWYMHPILNHTWTDLRSCNDKLDQNTPETSSDFFKSHMGRIRLMYNVGYGVSLASLLMSVVIMIGFKKLHCPRNTIHLNLFFSFILRASFSFMKENLLVEGLGFPSDVIRKDGDGPFIFRNDSAHWKCKLFFTCFHYILGANYMWITGEALYLHMLISVAVFSEKSSVKWYILFGWGSPLLFVIPWVVVRAVLEDVYCWNTHPTKGYFWIMRGPIVLSILVNFVFFLYIIRVLFTKLNAVHSPEAKKFRKLAKSTLVLIPLFGVHYIVFAGLPKDVNPTAELIQLYFEMFFNSVQGFFVAILFCFLNGEVQSEIKKKWHRFRLNRLHHLPGGRNSSHNFTTTASYLSRPRESNASVSQFQEPRGGDPSNGNTRILQNEFCGRDLNGGLKSLQRTNGGTATISEAEELEPMIGLTPLSVGTGLENGNT